jgi:hypothetical protein
MLEEKERRIEKRFVVDPVVCHTMPKVRGICVLRNVSLQGAFFLHQSPPKVGSSLKVEFSDPPLQGYSLGGKVIRHNTGNYRGFALKFLQPHPKVLRAAYYNDDFEE